MSVELVHDDCLTVTSSIVKNWFHAVVTDPPYALGFMNKDWDQVLPSAEYWYKFLQVTRPGGHLLAFGGTRTHHRLMCEIEDAGWEIRDCLIWLYGSGFPKSLDVSKAIDKKAGAKRKVVGTKKAGASSLERKRRVEQGYRDKLTNVDPGNIPVTEPATDEARAWDGWGTALKPAWEPIILARKPLFERTVAENVLKWGTGGLHIDACRVGSGPSPSVARRKSAAPGESVGATGWKTPARPPGYNEQRPGEMRGRWPANVILDEEAGKQLDEQSGELKSGSRKAGDYNRLGGKGRLGTWDKGPTPEVQGDSGGASRFFYCAKASKKERGEGNTHPTVKPLALMRYLVRLVTPAGGVILDPFMGSGTTGIAALEEGFSFLGVEKDRESYIIAENRVDSWSAQEQIVKD